jgi:hypothetical protein
MRSRKNDKIRIIWIDSLVEGREKQCSRSRTNFAQPTRQIHRLLSRCSLSGSDFIRSHISPRLGFLEMAVQILVAL